MMEVVLLVEVEVVIVGGRCQHFAVFVRRLRSSAFSLWDAAKC